MCINGRFSSGLNLVGFFEPLISNFGAATGNIDNIIPEGKEYAFFYSSCLLILCIGISLVGASLFSRSGSVLFVILTLSIISIPLSVLVVNPFTDPKHGDAAYTGFSLHTLSNNLLPKFTSVLRGARSKLKKLFKICLASFSQQRVEYLREQACLGICESRRKAFQKVHYGACCLRSYCIHWLSYQSDVVCPGICCIRIFKSFKI